MSKSKATYTFLSCLLLFIFSITVFSCSDSAVNNFSLQITSIEPDSGYVGDEVIIRGNGFVPQPKDNIVLFNNTRAEVIDVQAGQITARVPVGATTGPVVVKIAGTNALGPVFTVLSNQENLAITGITPTSGSVGSQVTFIGTGFSAVKSQNTVRFNGTLAEVVSVSAHNSASKNIENISKEDSPAVTESTKGAVVPGKTTALAAVDTDPDTLVAIVPQGATTGPVQLTVDGNTVTGPTFTVTSGSNPPTVISVSPLSGKTCTDVTITGTNFSATTTENIVKFNGTIATVKTATTTELVVTVPSGATDGTITVMVNGLTATGPDFDVTGDGCSATTPTISGINPTSGPIGTEVTITGTNFSSTSVVKFNGTPVTTIKSASDTQLVVVVPAGATDGPVTVTVNSETATGPVFDVTPPAPTITNVNPTSGKTCTDVTITGTNFSATASENIVKFNGTAATVKTATTTELVVTVPGAATDGPITVTVFGQTVTGPDFDVTGDGCTAPAPTIAGINPTSGPVGTEVTITGTNFSSTAADNVVKFNGTQATIKTATATELVVEVPAGATDGAVTVTVNGQTATGPNFDVTTGTPAPPTIVDVNPLSGKTCTDVTITGTNFSATATENIVKFNGTTATVKSATTTELVVTVPSGATDGAITVTVNGLTATGPNFDVTGDGCSAAAPTISGINPTSGPVGTEVTITGTNFSSTAADNVVKFNGTQVTTIKSASATELVVEVPTGATDGAVTVTVNGQTATGPNFDVTVASTPPTIVDVNPLSGKTCTDVTITGTNFSATISENVVKFNGTTATVKSATTTELVVTVPQGATDGPITVTVNGLTATGPNFDVTGDGCSAAAPTISGINPTSGPVGTEVTITGTNFSTTPADNTVAFNGTQATVKSATATELVVDVPTGATDGAVTVTVGGQTATGPNFDVTQPAPTITGIIPTVGAVGTEVTIQGTNFSATASENTVTFNGTTVTVIKSASTSELVVEVPVGATTGPVAVTVNGQTATGPEFTVLEEGQPEFPIIGAGASVEVGTRGICLGCGVTNEQNVVDLSLNNFGLVQASAGVTGSVYVSVHSAGDIPAGGEAGFVVRNQGSLIGAGLLDDITLTTYLDGVQQEQVSGTSLLTLELVSGSTDKQFIFFTTTMPFDEIEIEFGGVVSAGDNFEVYAAYGGKEAATVPDPLIGGFTPERGPEGTEVTISGINFSATATDNTVTFNGTQATITSASETELVVTVPNGATTGPIEVLVGGKTATSAEDYIVGSIPLTGPNLNVVSDTRGICIGCSINDEDFVIDSEPDNYATLTIKVGLAASTYIAVEDLDTEYDPAGNTGGISKVGFVVARSGGVIDLGLLQNITIETYLNGTLQESFTDTGLAVVDLLSGSSTNRKFIGAEATMKFDQILIDFNSLVGADITYEVYSVHTNYFVK